VQALAANLPQTDPEKEKAGQIVRPNFDKTPNWSALTQAPNRGRSCSGYQQKASLSSNSFGGLATDPTKRGVSFRFPLPGQCFKRKFPRNFEG
jgi:hypothetical protein